MWYYKKKYRKKYYNTSLEEEFANLVAIILLWLSYKAYDFFKTNIVISIIITVLAICIIIWIVIINKNKIRKKWLWIQTIEEMSKLHWREFEEFIEFVFKEKWFKTELWKWTKDWWIDLVAKKDGRKYLVQCKKWNTYKITEPNLKEFYWAVKYFDDNAKWIYITTSNLTSDAKKFAQEVDIEIWDRNSLARYINEFLWRNDNEHITNNEHTKQDFQINTQKNEVICDKCWAKMIIREAKTGNNIWNKFLGCSNFPNCRNTKNIN